MRFLSVRSRSKTLITISVKSRSKTLIAISVKTTFAHAKVEENNFYYINKNEKRFKQPRFNIKMIEITIPESLTRDFIGIVTLDILHDAKGRGFLHGHKLVEITDLIAKSTESESIIVKNWVFKLALEYFLNTWELNISSLGLNKLPHLDLPLDSNEWIVLQDIVLLPIRAIADRNDEDAFVSLGGDKLGVEAQNYQYQKEKLTTPPYHLFRQKV